MVNRAFSCYLSEIEAAYIAEFCQQQGLTRYAFIKEAVQRHIDQTSAVRDDRQAFHNLVDDPACDYRLARVTESGQVMIANKHTDVHMTFNDYAEAADHILGEESQGS